MELERRERRCREDGQEVETDAGAQSPEFREKRCSAWLGQEGGHMMATPGPPQTLTSPPSETGL